MFKSYYARKAGKHWIINPVRQEIFLDKWLKAKRQIYKILVDLAANKEFIDYTALGKMIKVWGAEGLYCRDKKLHHLLGEISMEANEKGFPLLSALVVNKKSKEPGGGYWWLLERYYGSGSQRCYEKNHQNQLSLIFSSDWSKLEINQQYLF